MRRRDFLLSVVGTAVGSWPLAARAQKPPTPVIGILGSGAAEATASKAQMTLLDAGMRNLGLVAGRDYVFEIRWANGDSSRFSALTTELLAHKPSVIVVSTNLAAQVVQKVSPTIAIVSTGLNAPVESGFAASLARPGGTVTGVSTMAEDLLLKLVGIMRDTLPEVRRVAVMTNPTNPSNKPMIDMLSRDAASKELAIGTISVSSPADLDAAFEEMSRQRPGALFVLTDNNLLGMADVIIARALAQNIPTFGNFADFFARAGALFAYSRDPKEAFQSVARLLKKILDGAAPGDVPIEQPTKFSLVINLKTAKALGLEIPPMLLARADLVIE